MVNSKKNLEEKRIISPLSSTFMLTSIIGFILSVFYVPTIKLNPFYSQYINVNSFAIAFALIFALMFIASLISMTYSPYSEHLQIDEKRRIKIKFPKNL